MKLAFVLFLTATLIFWLLPEDKVIVESQPALIIIPDSRQTTENNREISQLNRQNKQALQIDISLKNLFDRYLLLYPDQSLEAIGVQLKIELSTQLDTHDISLAMATWQDYLDLKQALVTFDQSNLNQELKTTEAIQKLMTRQQELSDMRTAYLGKPVASAFYAEDDLKDKQTLSRMSIILDQSITEEQRRKQLQLWQDNLPEETRQQRHRITAHWAVSEMSQKLSGEKLTQARQEMFDAETVHRLESLDKKQSLWNSKIDNYTKRRQNLSLSGLSPADQKHALIIYLQESFSPQEQLRIRALFPQYL